MLRQPWPAPHRHSARAQALASFSIKAGAPNASAIRSVQDAPLQPGRLGGLSSTPRARSSGPPVLTPAPSTRQPAVMSSAMPHMRSMASACAAGVAISRRSSTRGAPASSTPVHTAHLVPPISNPTQQSIQPPLSHRVILLKSITHARGKASYLRLPISSRRRPRSSVSLRLMKSPGRRRGTYRLAPPPPTENTPQPSPSMTTLRCPPSTQRKVVPA